MTSNSNGNADTLQNREREASDTSPNDRRATISTLSGLKNRYSYASSETGESSTAASKRNSLLSDERSNDATNGGLSAEMAGRDGRANYRSHRSRNSGGFLLSNSTFDTPISRSPSAAKESPPRSRLISDQKGKAALRDPEKRHMKRKSNLGLGLGGSPLAGTVTTAPVEPEATIEQSKEHTLEEKPDGEVILGSTKPMTAPLDVDSAQIVSLALNLSESRRNASRRIVSSPIPPPVTGFAESMAGGSMRYHMQQQQRRPSRNVSPKPERGERAISGVSRVASGRLNSPLQSTFDMQDTTYQYHFSASTLARAEKAKKAIELMAQYRQLLEYVPPLKPQQLERTITASSYVSGSPTGSLALTPIRTFSDNSQRQMGRPYNPLQYIRNRKVRSRNSKAIDGEAQGFADIDKVSCWIQEVRTASVSGSFRATDYLPLPGFMNTDDPTTTQNPSPQHIGRSSTANKIKRPRIDWMTNPADMIADVFWLEQDDNKRLIENRHGRRIFPREVELKRPVSRMEANQERMEPRPSSPTIKQGEPEGDHRDTKLPEFKSIKPETEKFPDFTTSKARQKLRDVRDAALHHGHVHTPGRDVRQFLRNRSKSDSSSSDSESDRKAIRRRSGTADSNDRTKDILEKQMSEMIANESRTSLHSLPRDNEAQRIVKSIEVQKSHLKEDLDHARKPPASHSRSASLANRSKRNSGFNSSGRASLEVPGASPRNSLEGLDSTAPNSPDVKARRGSNSHIPSIAMDLSSPQSRHPSPSRKVISRVRSKVRPSNSRNRVSERNKTTDDEMVVVSQTSSKEQAPDSPETHDKRERSSSPIKRNSHSRTDSMTKPLKKTGSLRRGKTEDSSGIRGFLKSARNPVTRVSDMLWKKDSSPGHGHSSGISTDDSDSDTRGSNSKKEKDSSRESSNAGKFDHLDKAWPRKEQPSYLNDMPTFTSPFERRGRPTESRSEEPSNSELSLAEQKEARERRRKSSRAHLLVPTPKISVQSPASSPDGVESRRIRRGSSISDIDSRRNSFGVQRADSRLNAILGFPTQHPADSVPMTGLASLEVSDRRPSMNGRHWSISDRGVSVTRGPTTKREIARVRALLLSSGIKAKEISRRAAEHKDLSQEKHASYAEIATLATGPLSSIPKSQEHLLAARILSADIQNSVRNWQESADEFCNTSVSTLLDSISTLQTRLVDNLTPMTRSAADEADEVSKDLVTSQTLKVKRISDTMDKMIRTRRRRFRWLRRGGWVLVEWALVGVMWFVWAMVVLLRVFMGVGRGIVGSVRWLFFI